MHTKKLICVIAICLSTFISLAQEAMLGEIKLFAGNFAPKGWAFCQGQLLPISENQALFSILGTIYGGDGRTNFALPDMQGRIAVGTGQGIGLINYTLGQKNGGEIISSNSTQIPDNTNVSTIDQLNIKSFFVDHYGVKLIPASTFSGNSITSSGSSASPEGGSQTASIGQASIALNYIIAIQGVYPNRN